MSFSATERKTALGLASVFSTRMLGLFMIMPVFAIYGPNLSGFTPFWMGLAIGIYGLTQACLQIPMGHLSDRIGRKPVIYMGLVIFALGSVIAATADHIGWVTLGRALQGAGAISSAVLALAADLSREHQRPKVMAVIGIFIGLSFTLALFLGPLVAASYGLSGLFWLTAALALVAMVIIGQVVPNPEHKAPSRDTLASWHSIGQLAHNAQLWRLSSGVFVIHFCMTGLFTLLPPRLIAGSTITSLWQVLLPVLLVSFLLLIPMMALFNRRGKTQAGLLSAGLMMVLSVILFAIHGLSFTWIMVGLVLYFAGFNYLEASLPSLVAQLAPAGQKGSAMGFFASCQFGGAFFGGISAGALVQWGSDVAVWWVMAAVLVGWLLFARSLHTGAKLTAVALATESTAEQVATQLAQLRQYAGVQEAVYVAEEQMIYLKVLAEQFDAEKARQLLANKSRSMAKN